MSFISKHWLLSVGLVGVMLTFEALLSLTSGSLTLAYYSLTMGWPALLLIQPLTSPITIMSLSLLGATGCMMVLHVVTSYIEAPVFTKRILVTTFLIGASYLFFLSLARIELSSTVALLKAYIVFSTLPSDPYMATLAVAIQLSPPSSYGVSLGLKAECQFSSLSGSLLLFSSLFLLLLGFLSALSAFLEGWSVDRKVFYVTGTIASILAAFSEFLSPLSLAWRELNVGFLMLPPSLFGGDPRVEGVALLLLALALATLAFSQAASPEAEKLFTLVIAGIYASSLVCNVVFAGNVTLLTLFLLAIKVVAGTFILLVVFLRITEFLPKKELS
ncbi:MAG: hypothetical protein KIH01_07300 [Candidatus Freyarchaeota archaeon]|nr:hypothetical protein [Candidatus Jordarchaeia archaeon]